MLTISMCQARDPVGQATRVKVLYNLSFLKVEAKVRYVFKVKDNYVINITQSLHCIWISLS